MFTGFFNFLYELVCGINSDSSDYADGIFESVGLATFIVAVLLAFLFYIALGRFTNIFNKTTHWLITLVVAGIIGFAIAFSSAKDQIGDVDGYLIRFAIFNFLFAIIFFFLLSLLFKIISIHAKRTPF